LEDVVLLYQHFGIIVPFGQPPAGASLGVGVDGWRGLTLPQG
jgi:hypothetical protein